MKTKKTPAKPGNVFEKRCGAECRLESEKLSRLHRVASRICWHRNNCAKMMGMRCTCGLEELMTVVEETAFLSDLEPDPVVNDVSDELLVTLANCAKKASDALDTNDDNWADRALCAVRVVQYNRLNSAKG